jgi:hypothetical protein
MYVWSSAITYFFVHHHIQLKNKPHPRWANSTCDPTLEQDKWHSRAKSSSVMSDSDSDSPRGECMELCSYPSVAATPSEATQATDSSYFYPSSTPSPPSSSTFTMDDAPHSTAAGPTHASASLDFDLSAFLSAPSEPAVLQSMMASFNSRDHYTHPSPVHSPSDDHHHTAGHCGCLASSPEYTAMLELSLRLRKAAETLRHRHRSNSGCQLLERLVTWDLQTS